MYPSFFISKKLDKSSHGFRLTWWRTCICRLRLENLSHVGHGSCSVVLWQWNTWSSRIRSKVFTHLMLFQISFPINSHQNPWQLLPTKKKKNKKTQLAKGSLEVLSLSFIAFQMQFAFNQYVQWNGVINKFSLFAITFPNKKIKYTNGMVLFLFSFFPILLSTTLDAFLGV